MLDCIEELFENPCSDHLPVIRNLAESLQFCKNPLEEERHSKAVKLFGILEASLELFR
jgi:predicted house-cleaning noncanonical NTP pyrophosphatase (MazG superfamily)